MNHFKESHYDVVVLGSGISGLSCAILLAMNGKKVAVLEKHYKTGGYMHSFRRFGIDFETGAHYVGAMGEGQAFQKFLRFLGVYREEIFVELDKDGFDQFIFPGGAYQFSVGHEKTAADLALRFPEEREGLEEYFSLIEEVSLQFPTYAFDDTFDMAKIVKSMSTSLKEIVESKFKDPKLKALIYAYCTLHGVYPQDTPFGAHAIITDTLLRGAYSFQQSGDELAKSYVRRCEELGIEVYTRTEVTGLRTTDKMVSEVETNRGPLTADWVLSSLHPKTTFEFLDEDPSPPIYKKRISTMEESMGIFGVYGYFKGPAPFKPYKNYFYFFHEDPAQFESLAGSDPRDPPIIYLSRPGRSHEDGYPFERPMFTIHVPCDYTLLKDWEETKFKHRAEEYRKFKDDCARGIFKALDRYAPGFSENVAEFVTSTSLTNLHFNGAFEGSGYGIYHGIENTGLRAIQPITKIKNLLLTGQNTSFPGLQSSALSALRSVGPIIGAKKLFRELKEFNP